jgi:hypothetical protein
MSGLTTWTHVEPHARTNDVEVGLRAQVADPAWLLARQLQLGEFRGDDAGSPVGLHVRASWARMTRVRMGGWPADAPLDEHGLPYNPDGTPLEALVEGEPSVPRPEDPATSWPARVHGGRWLERTLADAGESGVVPVLRRLFPFTPAAELPATGTAERRYATVFGGRVTDAVAVRLDLRERGGQPHPDVLAAAQDPAGLTTALQEWAAAADRTDPLAPVPSGTAGSPAWLADRVEYGFAVAAPGPGGNGEEVVLAASAYDGTGIDWYTADVLPGASLGAAADAGPGTVGTVQRHLLPHALRYPGQPADRFWEMEDARVDLGAVAAGPTDLATMLAVEFAVIYGPDWFLAPLELPSGCVARVDWVVVRDTFGTATVVGTAAGQGDDRAGRQFQPASTADRPDAEPADLPLLVVPPAGVGALRGPVLEGLLLQRDELANLAWGIERSVLGAAGRPLDRAATAARPADGELDGPPSTAELLWRLSTPVPAGWVPFVATRVGDALTGQPRLVRALLEESGGDEVRCAVGQLLRDIDSVADEEVTSAGVHIRLLDQRARAVDGSTVVWRGRETGPGLGEARSRLGYDSADPRN